MIKITGYDYEYCCANYLRRHGFKEVQVTKASGDQGIDIIAKKHRKWYGIQCKYYTGPVGNKAVQEAYTGSAYRGCDQAVVITNSYFTDAAEQLAETTGVELWQWMQPLHGKTLKKAVPRPERNHRAQNTIAILLLLGLIVFLLWHFGALQPIVKTIHF